MSRSKVSEDLRRRYLASLRLPPMRCGCHDPMSPRHQRGDCKWGTQNNMKRGY